MERLLEQWIAILFVILTTVNKLFGCTHLFKIIYKHIAWHTKGKIVVILYAHGHMTITVLLVHDCVCRTKAFFFCSAMTSMLRPSVSLYFQKAIDTVTTVYHKILLSKLIFYGITVVLHEWVKSYLSERNPITVIDDIPSSSSTKSHGVPRGLS